MQTQINWIKYEGRTGEPAIGLYLVYGQCIKSGKMSRELRLDRLCQGSPARYWTDSEDFIIEYIAPLSEIERGIEEVINKTI